MILREQLKNKVATAQAELDKAQKALNEFEVLPEEKRLATILHAKLCNWNHTDGCGWEYDRGDWTESSRQKYTDKAAVMLENSDYETVLAIVEAL